MKGEFGKYALGENGEVVKNIVKIPKTILCGLSAKYALHTIIAQYIGLFLWLLPILKDTLKKVLKVRVPLSIHNCIAKDTYHRYANTTIRGVL